MVEEDAEEEARRISLPMLQNDKTLFGSTFAFRGEGSQYCKRPKKGRNRLVIQVFACDHGMVEFVASAWELMSKSSGTSGQSATLRFLACLTIALPGELVLTEAEPWR